MSLEIGGKFEFDVQEIGAVDVLMVVATVEDTVVDLAVDFRFFDFDFDDVDVVVVVLEFDETFCPVGIGPLLAASAAGGVGPLWWGYMF